MPIWLSTEGYSFLISAATHHLYEYFMSSKPWNIVLEFFLQLERHLWFGEFEIDSSSIVNNTVEVTTDYATKNYNTTEASNTVIDADNFLPEFVKNTIIGKMGKTIFLCNKFEFII